MSRPVIGIAAYQDRARWDIWDTQATMIQQSYVRGIAANGGRAVVLPPTTSTTRSSTGSTG